MRSRYAWPQGVADHNGFRGSTLMHQFEEIRFVEMLYCNFVYIIILWCCDRYFTSSKESIGISKLVHRDLQKKWRILLIDFYNYRLLGTCSIINFNKNYYVSYSYKKKQSELLIIFLTFIHGCIIMYMWMFSLLVCHNSCQYHKILNREQNNIKYV